MEKCYYKRYLTERKNAEDSIKNHVQELEELNTHKECPHNSFS
jgi:hypothetical protein